VEGHEHRVLAMASVMRASKVARPRRVSGVPVPVLDAMPARERGVQLGRGAARARQLGQAPVWVPDWYWARTRPVVRNTGSWPPAPHAEEGATRHGREPFPPGAGTPSGTGARCPDGPRPDRASRRRPAPRSFRR
jgi:hypothetical protein